jgi:hypothetical protein
MEDGNYYADATATTPRAAWKVVAEEVPEKTEAQAREIIRTWVKNGLLQQFEYPNPRTRKPVKGLRERQEGIPA